MTIINTDTQTDPHEPALSVIVVSWNTRTMLADCLASLEACLGDLPAEVFVVDNASTDGSPDMVRTRFPAARLIVNSQNRGFAAANNQALRIARGRVILLLNADTLVHGAVLQRSLDYLDAHPAVGVFGPRVLNSDGSVQPSFTGWPGLADLLIMTLGLDRVGLPGIFDRYRRRHADRSRAQDAPVISGCAMFVRRAAMEAVGLLDEGFFFYGEETDWCRRFAAAGWQLRYAPVGDITHFGGGSVRQLNHRRDVLLTEATVRLHRKHGGKAAAGVCRAILTGFNASRAVFWTLTAATRGVAGAGERARHFRHVVRDTVGLARKVAP